MAKIAIVNSSQMSKYGRMDAGFFVMLDEIKEDVERLEKQFDRQMLIKILLSFPDEIKNLLKKIPAASLISIVKNRRIPVIQNRLVCREKRGSLKGYSHGCLLSTAISISVI